MKKIKTKNGQDIKTQWLRIREAAAYCGISRSYFDLISKNLPHGGNSRTRIYHVDVLDSFINNQFRIRKS